MMITKRWKKAAALLLAGAMFFTMAGCGGERGTGANTGSGDAGGTEADTGNAKEEQDGNAGKGDATAMGRYVEEQIDLSDRIMSPYMDLCKREDGSLVILSDSGILVSKDNGATWDEETPDWLSDVRQEGVYIMSMAMAPDGTTALLWGEIVGLEDSWNQWLKLVLPDGTQVSVDAELTEEEGYFKQVAFGQDSSIFASTDSSIYQVQQDGSCEKILSLDFNPCWIWVKDGRIYIDNNWEQESMPVIYDLEAKDFIEDEVLAEFVAGSYGVRNMNGTSSCDMYILPGEEETVYIAGKKGVHRHALGGNMMEQIVDGSISLLSNPSYILADMVQLEEDAFLALFEGGRLVRFIYDPNAAAVPEKLITVYSLQENNNVRQAVSYYQMQNPDVFVSYRIGMDGNDSVAREDAIKKLNTEVMAGEGPDIFVMDDLPFDSYVSKGMLMDLTEYLEEYSKKEPLFDNVLDALAKDGRAYAVPATISIPQTVSGADGMEKVKNLSDLAGIVEQLRKEHPVQDIIGISGARGILKRFAATSEPKWITAERTVDREAIGEYLEQCKRIFDAQMDGLDEAVIEEYNEKNERMAEYNPVPMDGMDWGIQRDLLNYIGGSQRMLTGWNSAQSVFVETASINRNQGFENVVVMPMEGQCSRIFKPATVAAVSAVSGHPDLALGFMDVFLSSSVQGMYDGLPLNQNAFDFQFTPDLERLDEEGMYGSKSTMDEDGNTISVINSYWPSDEVIASFKEELTELDTAYIPDQMLEKAVFDQGVSYMQGGKTLDEALDEIESTVAIYMAE